MIGGGPAGATAARVGCGLGLRTIVLEASPAARWKPGEALSPECNPLLDRVGLSVALAARPAIAIRSSGVKSLWGSDEVSLRDGFRERHGAGWIVDRRAFEELMSTRACSAGAEWVSHARVHSVKRTTGGWKLISTAAGERALRARIVIDATGRPASIVRRLGAKRAHYERQIAVVIAWPRPGLSENRWLTVESAPDGWWYAASGPTGLLTVSWIREGSGTCDLIADLYERFAATRLLSQMMRLPPRRELVHEMVVNAGTALLNRSAGEGWLAVGDAAAAFDPVSSQGLANAIASGEAGAHAAHDYLRGDGSALRNYSARVTATYEFYRRALSLHFQTEPRWAERRFWKVRQSGVSLTRREDSRLGAISLRRDWAGSV